MSFLTSVPRCNLLIPSKHDPILIMQAHSKTVVPAASVSQLVRCFIGMCLIFGFTVGCNQNKDEVAVNLTDGKGPNPNNGNGKVTNAVPPLFSEDQLKPGQWIEWQTTAANGNKICRKWTVTGSDATGVSIEVRYARKCVPYDDSYIEYIKFNPDDPKGLVIKHTIVQNGQQTSTNGALLGNSIYGFIYGHNAKVEYISTELKLGEDNFEVFKIAGQPYYNKPGHPFHAFILTFKFADSNVYQFKQSEPAIEALPKTP